MTFSMDKNLYSTIIKDFPENIVITDVKAKIIDASENFAKFFGFDSRADVIGKNGFDLLSPTYESSARKDLLNNLILRTQKNFEYEFLNREGTKIHVEISSSVIKNKDGEPKCVTAIFRDVSDIIKIEKEQKEIHEILRKSQEMFQLVMDNIPQFISWKDNNSVYLGCNKNFSRIAGVKDPFDIIGKIDYDLAWKKTESESFFETDQLVMELDKPEYHIIEQQLQADGKQAWLDINKIPLHDSKGDVVGLLSTFEDITERVIAEDKLKNSEKKYRKLYESMLDGFISLTMDGRIVEFNLALKRMLEYDDEEIHDLTFKDITPQKWHLLEDNVIYDEILANGFSRLYEKEYKKKDGTVIPVELRKYLIRDDDNNALGVWAIVRDISERKKADEALKRSELRYRSLFENMNAAFAYHEVIVDEDNKPIDYRYIEANPAFESMTGLKVEDIIGKKVTEILPGTEDDPADWIGKFGNVGLTGVPIIVEDYSETIDHWYKVSGYSPKKGFFAVTFNDITERKKAEEALRESEVKYRSLFENMNAGFAYHEVVVDENNKPIDYKFIEANPAFERLTGLKGKEIIGKKVTEILPGIEDEPADWIDKYGKVSQTGIPVIFEDYSESFNLWYNVSSYSHQKGFFAVIFNDITERKKAEEALRESEVKYRRAYNLAEFYKDIFAHDISNILQGILTSVELCRFFLNEPEKTREIVKLYDIIKDEVGTGAILVSNVRKLSQVEEFEKLLEEVNVCKMLKEEIHYLVKNNQKRQINTAIDANGIEFYALGNDMLSDVIENILLNAVKYNENPIIDIIIKLSKIKIENSNFVKIEFIDNGIGIPDVQKNAIFQKEIELHRKLNRIGLGLSLAKSIIEAYNGNIWVEDKVKGDFSKGSNFVILMPEAIRK